MSRIYVASSWRHPGQPLIVRMLRNIGHEVYDFRNPDGGAGFSWREISPDWEHWSVGQFKTALEHPVAKHGFGCDLAALQWCDTCVLLMPCGRSAQLELGWAFGAGKKGYVLLDDEKPTEPELMYGLAHGIFSNFNELEAAVR